MDGYFSPREQFVTAIIAEKGAADYVKNLFGEDGANFLHSLKKIGSVAWDLNSDEQKRLGLVAQEFGGLVQRLNSFRGTLTTLALRLPTYQRRSILTFVAATEEDNTIRRIMSGYMADPKQELDPLLDTWALLYTEMLTTLEQA